jgi:hypothetical protein
MVPALATGTALQKAALRAYEDRTFLCKYYTDAEIKDHPNDALFALWHKVEEDVQDNERDEMETPLISDEAYVVTEPVTELDAELYLQCVYVANNDARAEVKVFSAPKEVAWVVTIFIDCNV